MTQIRNLAHLQIILQKLWDLHGFVKPRHPTEAINKAVFHHLMATISVGVLLVDSHWLDIYGSLIKVDDSKHIVFEDFKNNILCLFGPHLVHMNTMHIDVILRQTYRAIISRRG